MNQSNSQKAGKYCNQCGQKNFRPQRTIKELLVEFVEDWLNYDSKVFKTARMLIKPAALSRDYFTNSHHKNHYVTPIKLYLILSIIFLIMTKAGGFTLTNVQFGGEELTPEQQVELQQELADARVQLSDNDNINPQVLKAIEEAQNNSADNKPLDPFEQTLNCKAEAKDIFHLWPQWLDQALEQRIDKLCDTYHDISYLPEEKQKAARSALGLSIVQNMIEVIPQTMLFALPIFALLLSLFYLFKKRLYVEHLVLLIHSHSFMFAIILLYLGWSQLVGWLPQLQVLHLGWFVFFGLILYLFYAQKNFYQTGYWATSWRFLLFGILYFMIFGFMLIVALLIGLMST
ncbi:DUF3667 domain-containing protein [Kangiella koreensis]|uniref:DUF3667 domain-containing protein n=1 Tax=Kangiella koreensis (strain DSM 16069 / JCM 12317 / KCTC 12182 / SW-125) TaxID=523791 RepID=C7R8I1_KANKD|nr:DUF3667 domain-containing protein [Kangiella koreensis]ACV27746.1 hypothetical protein Kkor_2337 [Kangiella koreensis DSM 16069]